MKVRFEFTIDDLIDVGERSLSRSRVVRRLRRGGVAVMVLLGGLLFQAFAPAVLAGPARLAAAAGFGALCGLIYPAMRRSMLQRRLRAFWQERLSGKGPWVCEVELAAAGVTTRQFDTETSLPWSAVASFVEEADSVEIRMKSGGLVVVRNRAFSPEEEKRRFVELGRSFLQPR